MMLLVDSDDPLSVSPLGSTVLEGAYAQHTASGMIH